MSDELIFFNGLNGATGGYDLPPMTGGELAEFIRGERSPENLAELRYRYELSSQQHLGLRAGVDPLRIEETGWGVIFAHGADPAIQEALGPLIDWRRRQAGDLFRLFGSEGGAAYRQGESKQQFLTRHGVGPGPADPTKMPYYLLIVGSPQDIPYPFQYQLDVQYAVGRIHFDTLQEYVNYAAGVVAAEKGEVKRARRAAFFAPANPDDRATNLSADMLAGPLRERMAAAHPDWQIDLSTRDQAGKTRLAALLGGDQTPALLFTASHGMAYPLGHNLQLSHQGALVCQDWPGPLQWNQAIPHEHYFAGEDIADDASLAGMLAFCFACYGAGTPLHDEFSQRAFHQRTQIAPHPFVASLPMKMLGHPRGGALAVIGHVERAWGYSFSWPGAGGQTAVFESTLERLLDGYPVGAAVEYFNERYAELASDLSVELEEISFGKIVDPYELSGMWTANNDARGYAILGDPAVRLAAAGEQVIEQPVITVQPFAPSQPPAAPVTEPAIPSGQPAGAQDAQTGFDAESRPAPANTWDRALLSLTVTTYASGPNPANPDDEPIAVTQLALDGDTRTTVRVAPTEGLEPALTLHHELVREAALIRLAYLELLAKLCQEGDRHEV